MRKFHSIYIKNFITIAIIVAISFAIMAVSFAAVSYGYIINSKTQDMMGSALAASRLISSYASAAELDSLDIRGLIVLLGETREMHILITDETGTIVSCSDRDLECEHIGKSVPRAVVTAINNSGQYTALSKLGGVYDDDRYVVGVSLHQDWEYPSFDGLIIISGKGENLSFVWRKSSRMFLAIGILVMLAAFVVSFITIKKQAKPIKEIADAASRFGKGDFSVRVDENDRLDEIGELSRAFNKMADSLERGENARRDLIANVSHELKTPMTTITGFADGILDGTIPPEKEREYLGVISSETKRLSRLVRGMLDMSRVQAIDREEAMQKSFDLGEVIRLALVSLEKKITDRGLDVDANIPEEPVMVSGDRDSITQVVYNLIDNAAKFAYSGTSIGIELYKERERAFVTVSNEGDTISKEELPLIFDRFHKTDRSRSMDKDGVGLGLYIVKTILDSHGGEIYVTSENNLTTFVFSLALKD